MSEHIATIHWTRDQQVFATKKYSRRHSWQFDGGLSVPASSSPQVVPTPYSDASAVDPEEAFVAALSSCHMLWFLDIACRAGWVVEDYQDAPVGLMARNAEGRMVMTCVTLKPAVRFGNQHAPSREELVQLHHRAHTECFLANSVKTEILCEPVF